MAPTVIAQLFSGVTMVASLGYYPLLLAIHRPPPFLATMSAPKAPSRRVGIPALCLATRPAPDGVGHAVGREIPHDIDVYSVLRQCHGVFAFLLFLTFTARICAVAFHTLVVRDQLIDRMALWPTKSASPQQDEIPVR